MAAEPSVEKVQIMHVAAEPEIQNRYEAVGPCVKKLLLVLGCFQSYSGVPVMAGIIAKKISCIMLVPTMYLYLSTFVSTCILLKSLSQKRLCTCT